MTYYSEGVPKVKIYTEHMRQQCGLYVEAKKKHQALRDAKGNVVEMKRAREAQNAAFRRAMLWLDVMAKYFHMRPLKWNEMYENRGRYFEYSNAPPSGKAVSMIGEEVQFVFRTSTESCEIIRHCAMLLVYEYARQKKVLTSIDIYMTDSPPKGVPLT